MMMAKNKPIELAEHKNCSMLKSKHWLYITVSYSVVPYQVILYRIDFHNFFDLQLRTSNFAYNIATYLLTGFSIIIQELLEL